MKLDCIHFAHDYREGPSLTYHLIGIFNTLTFASFPRRVVFWVYAHMHTDPDESGAPVPLTLRMTLPNEQVMEFTQMPILGEPSGKHAPTLWWAVRLDADLGSPGYYEFHVVDTEWGTILGSKRQLVAEG